MDVDFLGQLNRSYRFKLLEQFLQSPESAVKGMNSLYGKFVKSAEYNMKLAQEAEYGLNGTVNFKVAVKHYEEAVRHGSCEAAVRLALVYFYGYDEKVPDYGQFEKYLIVAARGGCKAAVRLLKIWPDCKAAVQEKPDRKYYLPVQRYR